MSQTQLTDDTTMKNFCPRDVKNKRNLIYDDKSSIVEDRSLTQLTDVLGPGSGKFNIPARKASRNKRSASWALDAMTKFLESGCEVPFHSDGICIARMASDEEQTALANGVRSYKRHALYDASNEVWLQHPVRYGVLVRLDVASAGGCGRTLPGAPDADFIYIRGVPAPDEAGARKWARSCLTIDSYCRVRPYIHLEDSLVEDESLSEADHASLSNWDAIVGGRVFAGRSGGGSVGISLMSIQWLACAVCVYQWSLWADLIPTFDSNSLVQTVRQYYWQCLSHTPGYCYLPLLGKSLGPYPTLMSVIVSLPSGWADGGNWQVHEYRSCWHVTRKATNSSRTMVDIFREYRRNPSDPAWKKPVGAVPRIIKEPIEFDWYLLLACSALWACAVFDPQLGFKVMLLSCMAIAFAWPHIDWQKYTFQRNINHLATFMCLLYACIMILEYGKNGVVYALWAWLTVVASVWRERRRSPGYCYLRATSNPLAIYLGPNPTIQRVYSWLDEDGAYKLTQVKEGFWHLTDGEQSLDEIKLMLQTASPFDRLGCDDSDWDVASLCDTDLSEDDLDSPCNLKTIVRPLASLCARLTYFLTFVATFCQIYLITLLLKPFTSSSVPIILVFLANCMYGITKVALPRIIIVMYGSHGDKIPLTYYEKLMTSLGFWVKMVDLSAGREGKLMNNVESGRLFAELPFAKRLPTAIRRLARYYRGSQIYAPHLGLGCSEPIISYSLQPPMFALKRENLVPNGPILHEISNTIVDTIKTLVDIDVRIGSFEGCAPRSSDGINLLKKQSPSWARKPMLVACGSSGLEPPNRHRLEKLTGLDLEGVSVYCTDSAWAQELGYEYEPDTVHARCFCGYETVVCHGGAGTMATAVSCGAKAVSCSTLLDRDYRKDVTFQFTNDDYRFYEPVIDRMSIGQQAMFLYTLIVSRELRHLCYATGSMFKCQVRRCFCLSLSFFVDFVYRMIVGAIMGQPPAIFSLCVGSCVYWSLNVSFVVLLVKYVSRKNQAEDTWYVILTSLLATIQNYLRIATTYHGLCAIIANGTVGAVAWQATAGWRRKTGTQSLLTMLRVIECLTGRYRDEPGKIRIRLSVMSRRLPWLPIEHVAFIRSDGKRSLELGNRLVPGSTTKRIVIFDEEIHAADPTTTWEITTDIDDDKWDLIRDRMLEYHDQEYGPVKNCQTCVLHGGAPFMSLYDKIAVLLSFVASCATISAMAVTGFITIGTMSLVSEYYGFDLKPYKDLFRFLGAAGNDDIELKDFKRRHQDSFFSAYQDEITYEDVWYDTFEGRPTVFVAGIELTIPSRLPLIDEKSTVDYVDLRPFLSVPCTPDMLSEVPTGQVWLFTTYDWPPAEVDRLRMNFDRVVQSDKPALSYDVCRAEGIAILCKEARPVLDVLLTRNLSRPLSLPTSDCSHIALAWGQFHPSAILAKSNRDGYGSYYIVDPEQDSCSWLPIAYSKVRWIKSNDSSEFAMTHATEEHAELASLFEDRVKCHRAHTVVEVTPTGVRVNNCLLPLSPLASLMAPGYMAAESVRAVIESGAHCFLKRVHNALSALTTLGIDGHLSESSAEAILAAQEVFKAFGKSGHRYKGAWAPMMEKLSSERPPGWTVPLAPKATFVPASFKDTYTYYLSHLNFFAETDKICKKKSTPPMTPTEFRRRINRNPHIDILLDKALEGLNFNEGVDGQVLASRATTLASLSPYIGSRVTNALTEGTRVELAAAIINQNPDMYLNARLANPRLLWNRFARFGKYSAGGLATGVKTPHGPMTRDDLRKAGWAGPLIRLAMLPLQTGEWYPALSHSVPKSQTVNRYKLIIDPSGLRTIVATSPQNNISQGIFHLDQNCRHQISSGQAVGLPHDGYHLGQLFEAGDDFENHVSLDMRRFDRNANGEGFEVLKHLRLAGYVDHPCYEAIATHIVAAMKQTQDAYIINLCDTPHEELRELLAPPYRDLYDAVTEQTWANINDMATKAELAEVDPALFPGGVVHKQHGGSTGDSNTTWTNTNLLRVVVIYGLAMVWGCSFADTRKRMRLLNHGDDNMLYWNGGLDLAALKRVVFDVFGLTLTTESKSSLMVDQAFLGKRVEPGSEFEDDFALIGIRPPRYAVIHDADKLMMRFNKISAAATRNFKTEAMAAKYYIRKCAGQIALCAHQRELYARIRQFAELQMSKLPASTLRNDKSLKLPSYKLVLQRWYLPKTRLDLDHTSRLIFQQSVVERAETLIYDGLSWLEKLANRIPAAQLLMNSDIAEISTNMHSDHIFEPHLWCCFVRKHGRAPEANELTKLADYSPFGQFCAVHSWCESVGYQLPTSGHAFENYSALASWRLLVYTFVYLKTNDLVKLLELLPFGGIISGLINLRVYSAPKVYSLTSYMHYLGKGCVDANVSALMPKDPYAAHKRAASYAVGILEIPSWLGELRIDIVLDKVATAVSLCAAAINYTPFHAVPVNVPSADEGPWAEAARRCLEAIAQGESIVITAPTGSGKTRYLPSQLLSAPFVERVIVVQPRNILCEAWSKTAKALWKRRGENAVSSLMTCTYGFLEKATEDSTPVWLTPRTLIVFDEAHEKSTAWIKMMETTLSTRPGIMLTATPSENMQKYKRWDVPVTSPFPVSWQRPPDDLPFEAFVLQCCQQYQRVLTIVPGKDAGLSLTARLSKSGVPVKHVSSEDRSIPDLGIHIVATAVVDAGITIPGCDCVIDMGYEMVNDLGQLKTIVVTPSTATQRAGRTGRTNAGVYYCYTTPTKANYKPSPSITEILADSTMASHFGVKNPLTRSTIVRPEFRLRDNQYGMTNFPMQERVRSSISVYVKCFYDAPMKVGPLELYTQITANQGGERARYILESIGTEPQSLIPPGKILDFIMTYQPHYIMDGMRYGLDLEVKHNSLHPSVRMMHTGRAHEESSSDQTSRTSPCFI